MQFVTLHLSICKFLLNLITNLLNLVTKVMRKFYFLSYQSSIIEFFRKDNSSFKRRDSFRQTVRYLEICNLCETLEDLTGKACRMHWDHPENSYKFLVGKLEEKTLLGNRGMCNRRD
jgi:hypothetical protein